MLMEKIPPNNLHMELLLILKDIVDLVFAPVISVEMIAVLDSTIADHFLLFKELFPEERLKPKQHYLLHYADRPIKSNLVYAVWSKAPRAEIVCHYFQEF